MCVKLYLNQNEIKIKKRTAENRGMRFFIPFWFKYCQNWNNGFQRIPRGFSMDSDSLRLSRFILVIFHHGGSKPEVVRSMGFRCFPRGFSMIQTCWGYPTSFWPFSIMAVANRKWSSKVVFDASHMVSRWIQILWGYPTSFRPFFIMAVTNRKWFSQGPAQSTDQYCVTKPKNSRWRPPNRTR